MGSQSKQTIGHRYFFGIHMGISRGPVDEIVEIQVGDRTAWKYSPTADPLPSQASIDALRTWRNNGSPEPMPSAAAAALAEEQREQRIEWPTPIDSSQRIRIRAPNLFGGDDGEGGIDGVCDVMMGTPDQPVNPSLRAMLGGIVPAFRGVCTAFYDGLVCSLSKYPKPWKFRVRRTVSGWDGGVWYAEKATIWLAGNTIQGMNAAHILYQCLTDRDWGRGLPRARIDDASFRATADVLHAEGFGLCIRWNRQGPVADFMQTVQDHAGINVFEHPVTGLWTARPVRNDYDVNTLPLFTPDTGLLGIDDDETAAQPVGVNELIVNWRDPITNQDRQSRAQNLAAINGAGGIISETMDFSGIPTAALAGRVATRELRQRIGAKRYSIRLDRRGYQLEPGGVFRISWPQRGIANLVLRVARLDDGQISSGTIKVDAALDIFGLPSASYVHEQDSQYTPPAITPVVPSVRRVVEVNHRDFVAVSTPAEIEARQINTGSVMALANKPTSLSIGMDMQTRAGTAGPFVTRGTGDFCVMTAVLASAIAKSNAPADILIAADSAVGIFDSSLIGLMVLINDELMLITRIVPGAVTHTLTVDRGCIDTVPAVHNPGAAVFIYDSTVPYDDTQFTASTNVGVKLLTRTTSGILPSAQAPIDTVLIQGRQDKPYPPGNFRVNSIAYPAALDDASYVMLTWAHRDRILQADQVVSAAALDIGPEPGVAYLVQCFIGPTIDHSAMITGNALTWVPSSDGTARVEISAIRDGFTSWQFVSHEFAVSAFSNTWTREDANAYIGALSGFVPGAIAWANASEITGDLPTQVALYKSTGGVTPLDVVFSASNAMYPNRGNWTYKQLAGANLSAQPVVSVVSPGANYEFLFRVGDAYYYRHDPAPAADWNAGRRCVRTDAAASSLTVVFQPTADDGYAFWYGRVVRFPESPGKLFQTTGGEMRPPVNPSPGPVVRPFRLHVIDEATLTKTVHDMPRWDNVAAGLSVVLSYADPTIGYIFRVSRPAGIWTTTELWHTSDFTTWTQIPPAAIGNQLSPMMRFAGYVWCENKRSSDGKVWESVPALANVGATVMRTDSTALIAYRPPVRDAAGNYTQPIAWMRTTNGSTWADVAMPSLPTPPEDAPNLPEAWAQFPHPGGLVSAGGGGWVAMYKRWKPGNVPGNEGLAMYYTASITSPSWVPVT